MPLTNEQIDALVEELRASATFMWGGDADDKIASKVLHRAATALTQAREANALRDKLAAAESTIRFADILIQGRPNDWPGEHQATIDAARNIT